MTLLRQKKNKKRPSRVTRDWDLAPGTSEPSEGRNLSGKVEPGMPALVMRCHPLQARLTVSGICRGDSSMMLTEFHGV